MTFQHTDVPHCPGLTLQAGEGESWINAEWVGRTLVVVHVDTQRHLLRVAAIRELKLVHEQLFPADQEEQAIRAFEDVCVAARLDALPTNSPV